MCGITGLVHAGDARPPLEEMNAQLHHRGPDDRGLYWSSDGRVGLAQCRLAIIDLTPSGHQPMSDAAGDVWITFNGEIYNFLDLRRELESRGHVFRSTSDTEVVIAAYREWGDGMLERLNGMFAIALHDTRKRRLLLARDRAGEKPLFYRVANGALSFASELKALMADPRFPRTLDLRAVDFYLAYGYVPGGMCIFTGVNKLQQGEALAFDIDSGSVRKWRYWTLPEPPAPGATYDADALTEELELLLEDSVRRQLIADVPVGVLLSGGVDSSLVTAVAARVCPQPVRTFTISFPGHGVSDEGPYARLVADYFGTRHTELAADPATVEMLPVIARQYDEPMADASAVPTTLVSKLVRQQAKVALGGDGGDELFGGYPHYSWLLHEQRLQSYVPRPLRRAGALFAQRLMPLGVRGRNHLIGFGNDISYSIAHVNMQFDRQTRTRLMRRHDYVSVNGDSPESFRAAISSPSHSLVRRATETDFRTTMVDDYLVKVDRASMLNSLEIRAPFLDYRLIEFAFGRVPDALKANEQDRKILLRRLGAKLLPPALDLKRKQGFSLPLDAWFKGDWGRYMESIVRESPFDQGVVDALIRGQHAGRNNTMRIYTLTIFELWRRAYGIRF